MARKPDVFDAMVSTAYRYPCRTREEVLTRAITMLRRYHARVRRLVTDHMIHGDPSDTVVKINNDTCKLLLLKLDRLKKGGR